MIEGAIQRLQYLCETIPPLLSEIDRRDFAAKPKPERWSKKEILGHLIDSATNNHHRIVRGQFEKKPKVTYENHSWNKGNYWQETDDRHIILFWTVYNRHLLEIIKRIPQEKLTNTVETGEAGEKNNMTLAFVIEDYIHHMEYHLRQIVSY